MNVGLVDVDSHNFPNLCLMKLSSYHKKQGDSVEFWKEDKYYDRVYASKIFTESKLPVIDNAKEVIIGGSGVDLDNSLPYAVEHQMPDYTLYPQYDFAVGMLTRGCPRINHGFCITPKKTAVYLKKYVIYLNFGQDRKRLYCLTRIF